jgi:hypothetical protein
MAPSTVARPRRSAHRRRRIGGGQVDERRVADRPERIVCLDQPGVRRIDRGGRKNPAPAAGGVGPVPVAGVVDRDPHWHRSGHGDRVPRNAAGSELLRFGERQGAHRRQVFGAEPAHVSRRGRPGVR